MYRFLREPKWLAFLLLGLVGAIAMPRLGVWQIDRYHLRQSESVRISQRERAPAVPLRDVVKDAETTADTTGDEWKIVTVTGTYDARHQVLIANRSFEGQPGYHVVTPLAFATDQAVLINRGFVRYETTVGGPLPEAPPTSGVVTVTGRIRLTQIKGGIGPKDPAKGELKEMARVDIGRIAQQTPARLSPVYLELIAEAPTSVLPLATIAAPKQDASTNISYAVQWFIFTAVGLITWPLIIRREASKRRSS